MINKLAVIKFWGNIMTDTKTTITNTDHKEEQKEPSDARIILGPLVKYAAMGFVLVTIIITTAVTLDRQFNDIDREVAELHAQLAQARVDTGFEAETDSASGSQTETSPIVEAEAVQQKPANPAVAELTETEKPAVKPVAENRVEATPAVTQAASQELKTEAIETESTVVEKAVVEKAVVEEAVTEDTVVEATVAGRANRHSDFFDKSFDQMIAERNDYLRERDRVYLEEFMASRERQLQFMRERLAHREQRIREIEKRYQEIYDYRAANVKEMQHRREWFLPERI
jgi:hypothetical protein